MLSDEGAGLGGVAGLAQRAWIRVHGNNVTSLLSLVLGTQCLLDAAVHLGTNHSTLSAMNAAMVLCGASYQRFWARDRHLLRELLVDLTGLTARLEDRVQGEVADDPLTQRARGPGR